MDERRNFFSNHAPGWASNYPPETLERAKEIIGQLKIKPGEFIVDLGCGQGVLFPILSGYTGAQGIICGTDFSCEMLNQARNCDKVVCRVCGDATDLPYIDGHFDRVIALASFPHFQCKEKACREIHRILKPGGKFDIIHLLGRMQLIQHHLHAGGAVKNDILPDNVLLTGLLEDIGFGEIDIIDDENCYKLKCIKREFNAG